MEAWNRGAARWRGLLMPPLLLLFSSVFVSRSSSDSVWYQDLCSYKWEALDNKTGVDYTFKLCSSSPDTPCGPNAAVCVQDLGTKRSQSVGELLQLMPSDGLLVFSTAKSCPNKNTKVQSSISFQCGKTMGTPEFITESQCVHYFEWRTYAACKKEKFKPHKEVPCYVFDSDGKKHDLNPLIKLTGGYLVDDSDDDTDFYINVCRSLAGSQNRCPEGTAACLTNRDGSISVGKPGEPLKLISNDRLSLRYESETESKQCNDHKPAVTITFICPSQRQQGSDPKLTAKTNCRFEVEWVTEFACHRDYLESGDCRLTNQQHDLSIDLTQLSHSSGDPPYMAQAKIGNDNYLFYLNICGETSAGECNDEKGFISSCQVKDTGDVKKVAGRYKNQTLRYSDGDLTLLYPGGTMCSSGFQRMTIINFECSATPGNGLPVFTGEVDCTYYFNWQTAAACVSESKDLLCRVTDGKKHYDLSPLTRYRGSDTPENWEAVDANNPKVDRRRFYLNVCNKMINQQASSSCPKDAAVCAVGKEQALSLGKFLSSPQKDRQGNDLRLIYTDGGECRKNTKITSIITLKCKPGDVESAPVLRSISGDGCIYEFEWQTAAACVLSKVNGDECKVEDSTAGISFDLSPLRKANGGYYNVSSDDYQYFINVCGAVNAGKCPQTSGACQVAKNGRSYNLGEFNSRLSYYDGMIQLDYQNGTPYNNKQSTKRSTHISFLCDRDAGAGNPEFQTEDAHTYNFRWYTSYACPERPHECVVTDPLTLQQYDLSSLSKSTGTDNWEATDLSNPNDRRTYYINVCRPLRPIPGCDRLASVCQIKYDSEKGVPTEKVAFSNMGVAKKGPVIETEDQLMLEYTDGSACNKDGVMGTFTTRIHFICARGPVSSGPRFLTNENCTVNFVWDTEAACAISTVSTNQTCSLKNPNTGFEFNLQPLFSKSGYHTSANGKDFYVNICGEASDCGKNKANVSGCVKEDGKAHSFVGVEKSLQFSSNGLLTLTYRGEWNKELGTKPTFTISFVCDQNATENPLKLINETMSTVQHTQHDVLFEFSTPLACEPAPVECRVTDLRGNEYDLSDLSLEDEPFVPLDTSEQASTQKFFLSVCKPLPLINGCPMGVIGACGQVNGRGLNLGYVQSHLQARSDGSISIVYLGGDKCGADGRYSTRIIFQCDDSPGSPMFDRQDGCEYVFLWRTSEACPVKRVQGSDCKVKDPRNGYEYNLMPLAGKDYSVKNDQYTYHFAVCGPIQGSACPHGRDKSVASCQAENSKHRIAGLSNQNLLFDDGVIMINYTDGETCHKIYKRSTAILFSCDHSQNPGKPVFIKETPDCTYLFEWHTALACPPFKTISCSYNQGSRSSYDLSSLALHDSNWVVVGDTNQRYYINVCKSLVPQSGSWGCPSGAAACLKTGDDYVSIGEVQSEPQWEEKKLMLSYTDGAPCPGRERNRTTIIRFICDHTKVDSKPTYIGVLDDCEYSFVWFTAAACPLNSTEHEDCKVSNPLTGHLFDLNQLSKDAGYTVYDSTNVGKTYQLNVCAAVKGSTCPPDSGMCIRDTNMSIGGGKANRKLVYKDQVLELIYEGGDQCAANPLQRHKSIISFICKSSPSEPELVDSDLKTCTHFFSWHTPLVCEQKVSCSVWNGTNLIDLSPLINLNGYYTATDEDVDKDDNKSPDFYINVCQPLNPIPGVKCPPGAAVCMDPSNGDPIDIGRVTSLPQYVSATNEVIIEFNSSTSCDVQPSSTYTSRIIFTCQQSTELGSPVMMHKLDCTYVFEWATPVVCLETVSAQGCKLQVSQLKYTFDLTRLSGDVQVSSQSGMYHLNVCGNVAVKGCKNSPVCLVSGGASASSYGISQAMSLNYSREDQAVVLKYGGGDPCPPVTKDGAACHFPFTHLNKSYSECISDVSNHGQKWCATTANYDKDRKWGICTAVSAKKQSTILFTCDRSTGRGNPQLLSETLACSSSFRWPTDAICPPKKMECKLVSKHQTYDLRTLSSLTEPWKFSSSIKGDAYFMNLCQGIHGGLTDCPEGAAVCRRQSNGKTQSLGQLHTQSMGFKDGKIQVNYTLGELVCENSNSAKTVVQLSCGNTVGHPRLLREDLSTCEFWVAWETRAACAVKQQEVEMRNGTIRLSPTGAVFNLGSLYSSLHQATGDIRGNGDSYIYHIQLSGITNKSLSQCLGANICQVKKDATYCRKIGSSNKAKYYIKGDNLDILVPSESVCGRDKSKTVSSTILFHCNPLAGEGIPEFLLETDGCQYLFVWHTSTVCNLFNMSRTIDENNQENGKLSGKSQTLVFTLLLLLLCICLLFLLLHKRERRAVIIQKITSCCKRQNRVSYKYTKVNTDEDGCEDEMEWLMEELETPINGPHENGHITTKPVSTDALRSFSLDEQDSEEEVLSVPGVRVHSGRGPSQVVRKSESDEDLMGLPDDRGRRSSAKAPTPRRAHEYAEDSDEDLLRV